MKLWFESNCRREDKMDRLVRWMIRRSARAQKVLSAIDNLVYGKRWKPRPAKEWISYPNSSKH